MEEINIKDLFEYFISKIYLIIIILLIVISIGAFFLAFIQKPKYQAYTTLVLTRINDNTQESGAITQGDLTINRNLVSTYREIIKSRPVLKDTIDTLKLDYNEDSLADMIEVSSVKDTELIKITVKSKIKEETSSIANAVAIIFSERVKEIYNIENLSIIEKAELPIEAYNVNLTKQMAIVILLGFVISLGTVFIIYYFDNSIKDEEDIEKIVELPVIGVIPTIESGR